MRLRREEGIEDPIKGPELNNPISSLTVSEVTTLMHHVPKTKTGKLLEKMEK